MRRAHRHHGFSVLGLALLLASCTEIPTAPTPDDSVAYSQLDLRVGSGPEAVVGDLVRITYTAWVYDQNAPDFKGNQLETATVQFALGSGQAVIAGWDRGIPGMRVGGLRRLVVPPALGTGLDGFGVYPPDTTLVFEIELLSIDSLATDTAEFSFTELVIGEGVEAVSGANVIVSYGCWLYREDQPDNKGLLVDTSEALPFAIGFGQVIEGFERGVIGMRVGGRRRVVVPPELAYGETGSGLIPPNATLVYDIHLLASTEP